MNCGNCDNICLDANRLFLGNNVMGFNTRNVAFMCFCILFCGTYFLCHGHLIGMGER